MTWRYSLRMQRAVVVGSGIGGTAAAMLLAHAGIPITLVEKNRRIGGSCSGYDKQGFHIDIGTHMFCRGDKGPLGDVLRRVGEPRRDRLPPHARHRRAPLRAQSPERTRRAASARRGARRAPPHAALRVAARARAAAPTARGRPRRAPLHAHPHDERRRGRRVGRPDDRGVRRAVHRSRADASASSASCSASTSSCRTGRSPRARRSGASARWRATTRSATRSGGIDRDPRARTCGSRRSSAPRFAPAPACAASS